MRLLLVEDDPMIGESLEDGLRREFYAVDWVRDGQHALIALEHQSYDLIVLDLGLPKMPGLDVLTKYRSDRGDAAVLIVTARDTSADCVRGLDAGADDYLIKPFDFHELFARLRALQRRRQGRNRPELQHLGLSLNPSTHACTLNGSILTLSSREFTLLQSLMEQPGTVISKAQLEERLYGWNEAVESNAVEVHIHTLRKKIGFHLIENIRSVGYRMSVNP